MALTIRLTGMDAVDYDLPRADRAWWDTGAGSVPLGTFTGVGIPVVAANELTIYVAGRGDIWKATRAAKTDNFGEPAKVTELDSDTTREEPSWVSGDGCDLYFSSNRAGATGSDLYVAHRGS
jgi:hypothetical protein